MNRILVLEPYYGGSHKYFLDNLAKDMDAEFVFLTLPARKWKMRMQLSAPWFVACIENMAIQKRSFDTVLCSTFVDVVVFKALTQNISGWNQDVRYCTYFHENQFAYPNQSDAPENFQFTSINFNTALASDVIAFNSHFNKNSFLEGCRKFLKSASDIKLPGCLERIERKCSVIYPGIDFKGADTGRKRENGSKIVTISWNHRWEHDKNPDEFFDALYKLKKRNIRFNLIVLGESFRYIPDCFNKAKKDFKDEIVHFGYVEDKAQYYSLLSSADIVVSTAIHEFFGIAVLEAVRCGCFPILPKRVSYPELFDEKYFYKDGKLAVRLEHEIRNYKPLIKSEILRLTEKYSWQNVKGDYQRWLTPTVDSL